MTIDFKTLYELATSTPEIAWCITCIFVWFMLCIFCLICLAIIMKSGKNINTEKDWRTK